VEARRRLKVVLRRHPDECPSADAALQWRLGVREVGPGEVETLLIENRVAKCRRALRGEIVLVDDVAAARLRPLTLGGVGECRRPALGRRHRILLVPRRDSGDRCRRYSTGERVVGARLDALDLGMLGWNGT